MSGSTIKVIIGPQHPALKEPERFILETEGEYVVDVKVRIGYIHRGIEKAMENRTYLQGLYLSERVCGICSDAHTTCYVQGVEELLGIEPPPRSKFIRVIVAELERIHSHLLWLGVAAHEIGFDTLFMYVWRDREVVMDLLELVSGNRVNYATNTIGGVRRDLNDERIQKILKGLKILEDRTKEYLKMIEKEQTVLKRTVDVGILSKSDAIKYGAVGPTVRASGVKRDVRVDDPYAAYDELSFNVIVEDGCDCLARIMVRGREVLESIHIIREALKKMPDGEIRVRVKPKIPPAEALSRVEAPRGELLYYIKSNGTDKPERCKIRTPTLANIPSLCRMLIGGYIADVPIVLAGIDPCFACMDRVLVIDREKRKAEVWTLDMLRRYGREWYRKR